MLAIFAMAFLKRLVEFGAIGSLTGSRLFRYALTSTRANIVIHGAEYTMHKRTARCRGQSLARELLHSGESERAAARKIRHFKRFR